MENGQRTGTEGRSDLRREKLRRLSELRKKKGKSSKLAQGAESLCKKKTIEDERERIRTKGD